MEESTLQVTPEETTTKKVKKKSEKKKEETRKVETTAYVNRNHDSSTSGKVKNVPSTKKSTSQTRKNEELKKWKSGKEGLE